MLKKQVEFPILEPETSNKTAKKTHSAHTIDINTTQMMVSKQWVKSWCMYRWAGEGSKQQYKGHEAKSNAF